MKQQSNSPYDYTTTEMKNATVLDRKIFINSDCVLTHGHSINKSQPYLLISNDKESKNLNFNLVTWLDSYSRDGITHVIVEDMFSNRLFRIDHDMTEQNQCEWILFDSDHLPHLRKVVERMIVLDYCQST